MGPIHVVITDAECRGDGAKSDRHNGTPATTQMEPIPTVHPGPSQAVTATSVPWPPQDLSTQILNNPEVSQKLLGVLVLIIYKGLKATG